MEDIIFKLLMELKRLSNADLTSILWVTNGLEKQPIVNFMYDSMHASVSFRLKDTIFSLDNCGYEQTVNNLNKEINRILSNLL